MLIKLPDSRPQVHSQVHGELTDINTDLSGTQRVEMCPVEVTLASPSHQSMLRGVSEH